MIAPSKDSVPNRSTDCPSVPSERLRSGMSGSVPRCRQRMDFLSTRREQPSRLLHCT